MFGVSQRRSSSILFGGGQEGVYIWRVKGHGLHNKFFSKLWGGATVSPHTGVSLNNCVSPYNKVLRDLVLIEKNEKKVRNKEYRALEMSVNCLY